MDVKPFSNEWVEGFISEACDMGLSQEQAQHLLKTASMMELSKDPNFMEGYNAVMQKQGAPVNAAAKAGVGAIEGLGALVKGTGKTFFGTGPRAAVTTGAGLVGAWLGNEQLRQNWGVSPEQGELIRTLDYANPQDYENIVNNWANNFQGRRLNQADALRQMYRGRMGSQGAMPSYMSPYMF